MGRWLFLWVTEDTFVHALLYIIMNHIPMQYIYVVINLLAYNFFKVIVELNMYKINYREHQLR